ncbi:MAG: SGNH/GDSL hydrolase family protein [Verrucomicrobia bacterium]|nr:MAG: SGNH/GDSL hydrolase family protein [Verrucomicrobiota bacterium]TAE88531.1 MAG: SGNH/GDSL hydrolase family protein [Verrucomicrobiota bacterium]TAF26986.1 MAG: SGNH/GDSL hydrolase family protein [Verrucomicrobiota bacterium]TAF42242.1 MAG: SGNH/GDSL hydrolase family protein [Verrucomicrobiota bacterium]
MFAVGYCGSTVGPGAFLLSGMSWRLLAIWVCLALASVAVGGESRAPDSLTAAMKAVWPKNRSLHFVFHGHSVPAGYHKTPRVRPFESYPLLAVERIQDAYPHAVINAIVTAIGGEDSVKGAARFEADVLSLRPDVIFIDYALNDRRRPVTEVEQAWRSMARAAKAKGVPVVFVTPTGAEDVRIDAPDEALEIRAEIIRRVAREEAVPVADVWAAWKAELKRGVKQESLLSQVNHPNRAGHEIAARTIAGFFGVD